MGTKLEPGLFDCYENAKPNEPMFILLARDETAPDIVVDWAMQRLQSIRDGKKPVSDIPMLREALNCAVDMVAWRVANRGTPAEGQSSGELPTWHNRRQGYQEQKAFQEELDVFRPTDQPQITAQLRARRCENCKKEWDDMPLPTCIDPEHRSNWLKFSQPPEVEA